MADSVEQCRFIQEAPHPFSPVFDLNHAATSSASDCESGVSVDSATYSAAASPCFRLIQLSNQGDKVHDLIKNRFLSGLGQLRDKTTVEAIHKNCYSSPTAQARAQAFQIYLQATHNIRAGDPNVKYAWYPASKEHIINILSFGFGHGGNIANARGLYGSGIYLSPDDHPLQSVKFSPVDKDGLRHLLLCRVILGKPELVDPGSEQYHPSSEDFDSGVDNLSSPKTYIVWSTHMNTHVLPEYVVSFRMPCCLKGLMETGSGIRKPKSPWMPFPLLISELSKILPARTMGSISKHHQDYREKKISRQQLIRKMREMTGDKLLIQVIKSFRNKQSR